MALGVAGFTQSVLSAFRYLWAVRGQWASAGFKGKKIFLFYFLAVLFLHCCMWAFSSCSERGLHFVVVSGLLIAVAS